MKRLLATAIVCAGTFLGVLTGAAAAAPAAPSWSLEAVPYPSAFEAGSAYGALEVGPGYLVQAYNVGGAATNGAFTVTATLPKGMLPAAGFPPRGVYGQRVKSEVPSQKLTCSALGRKITCTGTEGPVGPGGPVSVVVPVQVEAGTTGTLLAKAAIEGGGAAAAEASAPTLISAVPSPFDFLDGQGVSGSALEADGTESRQAGSHPYVMTVAGMNLTTNRNSEGLASLLAAGGGLKEAKVELPRGIEVNPEAAPKCKESELEGAKENELGCPLASQVGTVALTLSIARGLGDSSAIQPLFNMVAPPGSPAEFAFRVTRGSYVHLLGGVSSDGTFTLTASSKDILARVPIGGVRTTLWGDPSASSHDAQRGACLFGELPDCSVERTHKAFVTLPAACSGPLTTTAHISSWEGDTASGEYDAPQAIEGCESLSFEPTIKAQPTNQQTDSPTGLGFDLHQTQDDEYEDAAGNPQRATAPLAKTTVTLPEGMVLNPSAANGRAACTAEQIGLVSPIGQMPIRYREESARCPGASKVGSAEVTTPLLDHPLSGAIYLAKPFDNPFGSLLSIYLVVEDERSGIIAKLAGKVEPDLSTGQLRTTFTESPQLPLENVHLEFFSGPRAALTTPLTCGQKTTTGQLTPWSRPNPTAVSDSFQITSTPAGGPCPGSEGTAPNAPGFSAGTTQPVAGSFSPFVLKLIRGDGSQRIEKVDTTLPEGLTGRLAGIPYCSEAQIGQAMARSHPEEGKLERQSPSCPLASEVGTVTVGAGSGSAPVYVQGHAYLAGPYKGAPLSMVIITPAVTGPFDLGVVVVRVALQVDLETAQIHAVSDPLPTILQGIPLDVRSIALDFARPQFIINPTNCSTQALTASVTSPAGSAATLSERFGVEGCRKLKFHPKLAIKLKGATKRSGHPALRAVVTYPKKGAYANIARAQVGLPHSEFLDQNNLNKVCTQPQLRSDTCPAKSIYGHAKAWTPLLDKPLEGPVYLGVGFGYKLPALVADLNGQVRILLKGRVDTTMRHGIRNTFEAVPDAPVSRFVLEMKGGKKYGLLQNSENICRKRQRASARFVAQNGRVVQLHPTIANSCKKAKKHHGRGKGHHTKGSHSDAGHGKGRQG